MSKKSRREEAIRKKKQKKIITIVVCVVAVLIVGSLLAFILNRQSQTRVFYNSGQTVTLYSNGKFTALLSHNAQRKGTYSESTTDGNTMIVFTYDGITGFGSIEDNVLTIPDEWNDGHGHGTEFLLDDNN